LNTAGGVVKRVKLRRVHVFGTTGRAWYGGGTRISSSSSTATTAALPASSSASLGSVLAKNSTVLSEGRRKALSSAVALASRVKYVVLDELFEARST